MTMRYMIGKIGAPQLAQIQRQIPDVGMLLAPAEKWQKPSTVYACDNGVFAAYKEGRTWDATMHCEYVSMLAKLPAGNAPEWVLLPDVVADWNSTVELARLYIPTLKQNGIRIALALQDGCNFAEAEELEPDTVFVAGLDEWKEANIHLACDYFLPRGIGVHVGRVNTRRRLKLCQSAGADSADGTTLNLFRDSTLPLVSQTLWQPCLRI